MMMRASCRRGCRVLLHKTTSTPKLVRKQQCRDLSSLGSPMFPQRAIPEVDPTIKKKIADDDDSFLARHGGKVGIVALFVSGVLLYTYFKGNSNKSDLEKEIDEGTTIEPYEIQEMRYLNKMQLSVYAEVVKLSTRQFGVGSNSSSSNSSSSNSTNNGVMVSYKEFIELVRTHFQRSSIPGGYLLDRLVYAKLAAMTAETAVANSEGRHVEDGHSSSSDTVPLNFLLVALNLAMAEAYPDERLKGLYQIAVSSQSETQKNGEYRAGASSEIEDIDESSEGTYVGQAAVTEIIHNLIETNQIPPVILVAETGVKYPIRTYRKKTAEDMVVDYHKALDPKNDTPKVEHNIYTEEQFLEMLCSRSICVWGECYR